jgi:hypothetical protein
MGLANAGCDAESFSPFSIALKKFLAFGLAGLRHFPDNAFSIQLLERNSKVLAHDDAVHEESQALSSAT